MNIESSKIYFKIINIWLSYIFFLSLIANLPHYGIPFLSWVNLSLYFLIFLQCIFILRRTKNNKEIFVNLGLLCLVYSVSIISVFIGKGALIENTILSHYIYQYRKILVSFLLSLSIIYICVRFVFNKLKPNLIYLFSFLIILPIFWWHFGSYILDRNYVFNVLTVDFDYETLFRDILYFTFFPFFFICAYGLLLYKEEKSLGEHVNGLMVCFFIMTLLDIVDIFGELYEIKLFTLSQYVILINLTLFVVTLFNKINFIYSDFGQFYEELVVTGNKWGVPIKRKRNGTAAAFLESIKVYFNYKKNTLGFLLLFIICSLNYLNVSLFLKLNITAATFAIIVLFFYISALYQKRLSNGNLLSTQKTQLKKGQV